jgi:predicted tellurium resistance membrane protein TerC
VLAIAAAARNQIMLIIFGLAISIPLIVAGATLILNLLNRFPILVWAGAALLGWVAGELMVSDPVLGPIVDDYGRQLGMSHHAIEYAFAVTGAAIVILAGIVLTRTKGEAKSHAV